MQHDAHSAAVGSYIKPCDGDVHVAKKTCIDYVKESGMLQPGKWGTDVEIIIASTILQCSIILFQTFGRKKTWVSFRPLFANDNYIHVKS